MPSITATLFLILRLGLGIFFVWSGLIKLADLDAFTEAVFNYQILFPPYDGYAAYFVAWLEVIAGLATVIGRWGARGGLLAIAFMLAAFNIALGIAASKGLNINCGCFGSSEEPTNYLLHIGLNLLLWVLAIILLWREFTTRSKRLFSENKLSLPNQS
ncbi:DoxX family protein [Roseibacillus persicicus]|uniref:DoxX family protein n=1 Tax=Roseibacillus persicicus TaxID=454148 RepID=UPI00280C48A5|nr:DoxX family protein [Roseibacillus persicicus]MDQ8189662.1 DoxX family protein [Roseibacillus persicicus]